MALDNVKNILLVLSGKGGVGKSSITTQLALSLSLSGHSVGILDVDLTGPSIPRFLGIESSKIKQAPGGWLPVEVHASQNLPPVPLIGQDFSSTTHFPSDGADSGPSAQNGAALIPPTSDAQASSPHANPVGSLYAMSLAFLLASRSTAIVWRGPKKTAMVRQFLSDVLWPQLDYLLIDTPPGTSDEHISVIETLLKKVHNPSSATSVAAESAAAERIYTSLAGAVIVTTPQAVAISDVRKEINFCAKTGVRVVGVVENMSGYVCPCCGVASNIFSKGGGQVMAEEFGVPFLGGVPIDGLWGQLVEEGIRPVYGQESEGSDEMEVENGDEVARHQIDGEEYPNGIERGCNMEERIAEQRPRDEALLVDKYRSCSLYPVFQDITRKVTERVANGTAVTVNPSKST